MACYHHQKMSMVGLVHYGNRSRRSMPSYKNTQKKSSGDIRYFDAGSLFLSGERYIDSDLMPDFLHPSSRGFKKWGNAIKKEIDSILKKP
mmetsp:Transcript_15420/g.23915  ORF Transcript_15420/g.23915 Transcript_15420/m.23915 type:complete len:90 (+) Transcript_15420:972-1241(+)